MMHSRPLFHFLIVSECGSISAAAEKIGVTQPAITRSIKQLESTLGTTLLDRFPTGVALTSEGRILARRVKLMNLEYEHAVAEIADLSKGVRGRLRISAGPVWILQLLPPVLKEYYRLYPEVRISLVQGGFNDQFGKLLSGDIDAMCGTLDFPHHAEIEKEPITPLKQSVIARAGHPLFDKPVATPRDLAKYPWVVMADDSVSTTRIGSYFLAHGLEPPEIVLETNTLGSLAMLKTSDWLTTFAVQGLPTLQSMGYVKVEHEGTFWEFESGIARRKSSRPTPALQAFIGVLRSAFREDDRWN